MDEGGTGEFTVSLTIQPTATVTVSISSEEEAIATALPRTLSFTPQTWNTQRTVTVTGVHDSDTGDDNVIISLRAAGGDFEGKTGSVAVTVTDDDVPNSVRFGASTYSTQEGGRPATVVVQLARAAEERVTIPLVVDHLGSTTAADYSGVPTSVTFSTGQTSASFSVTATDDQEDDDGERIRITFDTLPARVTVSSPSRTEVNLNDNDSGEPTQDTGGSQDNIPIQLPIINIQPASATEGEDLVFNITIAHPSNAPFTLSYDVVGVTANPPGGLHAAFLRRPGAVGLAPTNPRRDPDTHRG